MISQALCNPKFISYAVIDIPPDTSILDAVKMYIGKPKDSASHVDKSLKILDGYGYHII